MQTAIYKPRYRWTEDFKGNRSASEFKTAIERILSAHHLLNSFAASVRFHARIDVPELLSLTILRDERNLTVANYFLRDGEQEMDPGMDFEIAKDGAWYPIHVHFVDDFRSCVDGPLRVDFEERRKQAVFAAKWAGDLLAQGYDRGDLGVLSVETA